MEPEKKSNGAMVGLVVILIILILGGIYIWQSKVKGGVEEKQDMPSDTTASVSSTDAASLDSLDQELNSTDTNAGVDVNTLK